MRTMLITAVLATVIFAFAPIPEAGSHKVSANVSQSQSGSIVFSSQRDGNQEIYSLDLATGRQTNLTQNPADDGYPRWSPNGQKIAFATNRDGNWEVYTMNADGSGQKNLTKNPDGDGYMDWSPDSQSLVFASTRNGNKNNEIYTVRADGTTLKRLTNHVAEDVHPSWSPDGKKIAFASERNGNRQIYVMNADGSGLTRLTNNRAYDDYPAWSPDGSQIAFASDRNSGSSEKLDIYIMNADGTATRELVGQPSDDRHPAWSADGKRIAFSSDRNSNRDIFIINTDGSGLRRVVTSLGNDEHPYWNPSSQSNNLAKGKDSPQNTGAFKTFRSSDGLLQMDYPSDWKVLSTVPSSITITHPEQSANGQPKVGTFFGSFQPQRQIKSQLGDVLQGKQNTNNVTLDDGIETVIKLFKKQNPKLIEVRNSRHKTILSEAEALETLLSNQTQSGYEEQLWIFVTYKENQAIYLLYFAPKTDFAKQEPIFNRMRSSFSFGLRSDAATGRNPDPGNPASTVAETEWLKLSRGKTVGKYQFTQDRRLLYGGRPIAGIRFRTSVEEISISPSAPNGNYAICVSFDDQASQGFLLQLSTSTGVPLSLDNPPLEWASWSPDGTHVVVGSYYEADMQLYSTSLSPVRTRPIQIKGISTDKEEVKYDVEKLVWTTPQTFRIPATVHCNPYANDSCGNEERAKVLREYVIEVNVITLAATSKRTPQNTLAPKPLQSSGTKSLLPPSIQEFLDTKYSGWKLAEPSKEDRNICFDKNSGFQPSLIWGDFNGDKQRDYAVQIVHRQKLMILAFLNQGAGYANYDLRTDPIGGRTPILSIAKKGGKYFDHERERDGIFPFDTITADFCESSSVSYIFRMGKFIKVITSD